MSGRHEFANTLVRISGDKRTISLSSCKMLIYKIIGTDHAAFSGIFILHRLRTNC